VSELLLPVGNQELISTLKMGLNECDNATYHADRTYLSSSVLKTLYKSLDEYYDQYILGNKTEYSERTLQAFDEGSYLHSLILEPETVASQYAFFTGWRKQGAEWEAFKKANKGKVILSVPQAERCAKLLEAYKNRPEAVNLIKNGFAEQTICGILNDIPIKVRFDYIIPQLGIIADVKTTGYESDADNFKVAMDQFSYELSASLYCQMAEQFYGRPFKFYFIVLSKSAFTCDVLVASDKTMGKGTSKVTKACAKYKRAKDSNIWTELHPGHDTNANSSYIIKEV